MMLILLLLLESKVWEASEFGLMREINKKYAVSHFPSFSALHTVVKNSPFNNAGCPFCQKPSLKNLPPKRIIPSEQAWWLMESLPSYSRHYWNAIEGLLMDASRTYCRCVIAKEVLLKKKKKIFFMWSAYRRCKSVQSAHLWSKPIDLTASNLIWWPLVTKFWWFIHEINRAQLEIQRKFRSSVSRGLIERQPQPLVMVLSTVCGDTKKFVKVPRRVRRMLWLTQDSFSSIFLECGGLEWLARCCRSVIKWKCSSGVACRSFVNDIFSCNLYIYIFFYLLL